MSILTYLTATFALVNMRHFYQKEQEKKKSKLHTAVTKSFIVKLTNLLEIFPISLLVGEVLRFAVTVKACVYCESNI